MSFWYFVKLIREVNPWKTIYFNFHYFPFDTAIRMPFFIYWRSRLYLMKGEIIIDAPIKTGMVKFGRRGLGTQEVLYPRTIWQVMGTVVVKGKMPTSVEVVNSALGRMLL